VENIFFDNFKSLAYPPTEDQLRIIGYLWGNIWILRFLSLALLLVSLFFWYKLIFKITKNKVISLTSIGIILTTPVFYILWLSFPFDCLKLAIALGLMYFLKNKNGFLLFGVSLFLVVFSFLVTSERSGFVHKLSLNDAKSEVQERFAAEDSLIDPVKVPLKIKRMVYNKYFIEYKEIIGEIIPFFDTESLFFQEIHPLEQKSVVIFVWPEVFLLIGGIYVLAKDKNKKLNSLILVILFLSLVNFLFDPFITFRKFELILFPLSLVISMAIWQIWKSKMIFGKTVGGLIVLASFYGVVANHVDLNKRPDFWLDNRPYFYEFIFSSIKERNLNDFNKVYVTSLVGRSENYCKYYLDNCDQNKFVFNSFELKEIKPEKKSIYAGFAGEFIGSNFKNNIDSDWLTLIKDKGFTSLKTVNLRDTIAYKFGNDVIVGEVK